MPNIRISGLAHLGHAGLPTVLRENMLFLTEKVLIVFVVAYSLLGSRPEMYAKIFRDIFFQPQMTGSLLPMAD